MLVRYVASGMPKSKFDACGYTVIHGSSTHLAGSKIVVSQCILRIVSTVSMLSTILFKLVCIVLGSSTTNIYACICLCMSARVCVCLCVCVRLCAYYYLHNHYTYKLGSEDV